MLIRMPNVQHPTGKGIDPLLPKATEHSVWHPFLFAVEAHEVEQPACIK